jgi:acyl transferase domain-containing protein
MMADAAAELGRMAATVEHRPRTHDIVSSVDGRLLDRGQARTPGYWADQLRSPVRYQDAVVTAVTTLTNAVLVEVGPGAGLSGLASQIPQARHSTVVALQPQRAVRAGVRGLLTAVGSLWAAGIDVRWPSVRIGGDRVELPTYPFARTRHWLDIAAAPPPSDELVTSSARGDDVVLAEIIELWQSMLGVPAITGDDDFFQLGGESLLFIRMVTRVQRKFGVALSVADLTGTPTPLAIADQVLGHQAPERVQ